MNTSNKRSLNRGAVRPKRIPLNHKEAKDDDNKKDKSIYERFIKLHSKRIRGLALIILIVIVLFNALSILVTNKITTITTTKTYLTTINHDNLETKQFEDNLVIDQEEEEEEDEEDEPIEDKLKDESLEDALNVTIITDNNDETNLRIGIGRNGCDFGWMSLPTPNNNKQNTLDDKCFYLGLIPESHETAQQACQKIGGNLATIQTKRENRLLCTMMSIADNKHARLNLAHIGLKRSSKGYFNHWNDGNPFTLKKEFWLRGEPDGRGYKGKTSIKYMKGTYAMLNCRKQGKWMDWSTLRIPYFCSKPKIVQTNDISQFKDFDGVYNGEVKPPDHWHPTPNLKSDKCSWKPINHGNILINQLERQYPWKTGRRKRGSQKRYYAVWQSKQYFGYQRYWVGYLEETQTFRPIPMGDLWHGTFKSNAKTSDSTSTKKEKHTGYFHSPAILAKYRPRAVFARLPIPASILYHLDEGTLVNQIYTEEKSPLGDKQLLLASIAKYSQSMNCNYDEAGIFPLTFDMSQKTQCSEFMQHAKSMNISTPWVVKGQEHGGKAVDIMSSDKVMLKYGDVNCNKLSNETVQRYIDNPLLLDGRKFDVRAFMLVASVRPLIVYMFNETYFRATTQKYTNPLTTKNKARHVTNTHVQKKKEFTTLEWENHLWNPERVAKYATKINLDENFASNTMMPKIKTILQFIVSSVVDTITTRNKGMWKLYAIDFVIDKDIHPWLVDVNSFPGFDWSFRTKWTLNYRKRLLKEMWDLIFDIQVGQANNEIQVPNSGGFELIYHGKNPY